VILVKKRLGFVDFLVDAQQSEEEHRIMVKESCRKTKDYNRRGGDEPLSRGP